MRAYHDEEWGVPLRDSRALWEMMMLEGFQAGLSWSIILKRREAFRHAFKQFDPREVAKFGEPEVSRLLQDTSIIRSRAKIQSTITGAGIYLSMAEAGENFADFVWSFVDRVPIQNKTGIIPAKTTLSETISKDLKRRGFKFVGPVIVYAWMQSVGLVNDHSLKCFRKREVVGK